MFQQTDFLNDAEQPAVTVHRFETVDSAGVRLLFRDALTARQMEGIANYLRNQAPILPKMKVVDRRNLLVFPNQNAPLGLGRFDDLIRFLALRALEKYPAEQAEPVTAGDQLSLF